MPTLLRPFRPPAGPAQSLRAVATTAACPKLRDLERWVFRHLGAVGHERRVAALATRLFHLTRPLHTLTPADLRLLQRAAVVHDVGRAVCDKTHPREGADLIQSAPGLPLDPTERRHLAYLTLYHKGPVPEAGRDDVLARADDADRLRTVLALLRAADALDGRSIESPRIVFTLAGRRLPRLGVACTLATESAKARKTYGRRKKFRLLEEELGCRVEIDVTVAGRMARVA